MGIHGIDCDRRSYGFERKTSTFVAHTHHNIWHLNLRVTGNTWIYKISYHSFKKKKRLATIILPPFVLVVNLKLQRSSLTINSIYFFNTLSSEKEKTNKICSNSLSLSKREIPPPNSTFVVTDELHRGCNKIIISALEHHFWIHRLHIFIISLQTDMQPRNLEVSFPQSLYSPPTLCACIINDIAQWA